jgi:stress-induced morphogen
MTLLSSDSSDSKTPPRSLREVIESKLRDALSPTYLEVINESHMHKVPKGAETHFKVVVVSPRFEGLSAVKRHQLVYQALSAEMTTKPGVHALAITSRTPAEWEASPEANVSPKCAGGSSA